MLRQLFCLTRALMEGKRVSMTCCPGVDDLITTHCQFCKFWDCFDDDDEVMDEEDEIDDPVIFEREDAAWEEVVE